MAPAPANDATGLLRLGPGNGGISEDGLAVRRPALAPVVQVGDAAVAAPVTAVAPGIDGKTAVTETTFGNAFQPARHGSPTSVCWRCRVRAPPR